MTCTPNIKGGNAAETFYISEDVGFVEINHSVNKGKEKIDKLNKGTTEKSV